MPSTAANPTLDRTTTAAELPAQIRILADDLTGACDSAAAFLAGGHRVRVWLGGTALEPTGETVQAFNLNSRALAAGPVSEVVTEAAQRLEADPTCILFKKVDSAGRGHLATEMLAAHRALETDAILFAPSFPAAGRTVRNGVLHVTDAAGLAKQIPLHPLFQREVLTAQISHPSQITRAMAAGATVLVCDAQTQQDLDELVALEIPNLLYAGSAGLAQALAKLHPAEYPVASVPLPRLASALTICGTPHPVTRLQTEHLRDSIPSHPRLHIPAEASDAAHILASFEFHNPEALILTGGDTALLVLTTLHAHSIVLRGEFAPGIPWGIIEGGLAHGRVVVTKSGGFGQPHTLTSIVQTLTGAPTA